MATFADVQGRCDDAPVPTGDHGRLFLWFPVGLALQKVRRHLRGDGRTFCTTSTGALAVEAPEGYPQQLVLDLADLLTEHEGADTRCVFKTGQEDLEVEDIVRVRTIHELRQLYASAWFVEMLRAERLTNVYQPIVLASETSTVLGHEALMRGIGENGETMSAGRLLETARDCGMLPELDWASRQSAIRTVASQEERRPLFLNLTPEAVRGGIRALTPTILAIESADIPRDCVVFEVTNAEQTADVRQLKRVIDSVRNVGFRTALDDVGVEDHSRRLIHEVRPDFVKLDMQRVRASTLPRLDDAERLLDLADQLKIETIAEGVETGEELEWNCARGATYVQGYYIARPGQMLVA